MDFRFTAHNPETGAFLHRLPRPSKVQIGDTFGTRGTLELTYSAKALNAKPMPTFVEIRQQATFDGGHTWADIGPNYLRLSGSHEDTDESGMRTVTFVSREWLLGKARVGPGDLPLIDNKRPFYQSSPGTIMRTLLLEAKDRGAAQGIEIGGFTGARDSSGNAWGKVATIYYSPGLPILNVLENLVEQGLCDYRMEGNTLHLFEPETTMGQDHTTGDNPVRVHGAVTEAPISYTLEELTTSALLIGEDGFELEVDNPAAPDDYGRLEVTIEQGGVNQEGTARIMVDEALQRGSREIREITRTQKAEGLKFLPYRDYRVGDFVQVRDQGKWQRYRVREVQSVRGAEGWTVHTVLNDRLQELLLKLAKRTNGIVNGSQGSGGDGTQPAPPAKPGIEPAAPEGLIVDQQVYIDNAGTARGVVTAGWGEVTQSVRGKGIDIGGYELWWRENTTFATWTRATSTSGETSVSHSPVVLTDSFGNAMAYQWRVRAVAAESARPGPWSNTVTMTMTQDTEAPNMPSVPVVSTEFRIITVEVDGLDEFGEGMPTDFNHTRIYFGSAKNMADAVRVGSLTQPGSWNSGSMDPDVPVWVAVSAVDNVGNESPMTEAVSVTPKNLIDDDSIRDAIEKAKQDSIDEAVTTAGGRTVHNKTTNPVSSPSDKEHDVWQRWTTLDDGGTLVAVWVHDGSRWVSGDITEQYVPRINIAEGTFGTMSGGRLKSNTVETDALIVGVSQNMIPDPGFANPETNARRVAAATTYGAVVTIADGILQFDATGTLTAHPNMSLAATSDQYAWPAYPGMKVVARASAQVLGGAADFRFNIRYSTREGGTQYAIMDGGTMTLMGSWAEYSSTYTLPDNAVGYSIVVQVQSYSTGLVQFRAPLAAPMVGSTIIEPGGIKTPHLASNAVTADIIAGGAIDGKLITGARIRTAATGRRTELDVEGLQSYDSAGKVVLTTRTSDGSIDMRGILRQTANGISIAVGGMYQSGGPGIQWEDSNIYAYPPGVVYGNDPDRSTKKQTLIQGPGVSGGNSFLTLMEKGDGFDLRTWKGVTSRSDWRVQASLADNLMRIGASTGDAPYITLERGAAAEGGGLYASYRHPNGTGYSSLSLEDSAAGLWAYNWQGTRMGNLVMDAANTTLSAGTRDLFLYGADMGINPSGGLWLNSDEIRMPDIPEAGSYATLVRSNGLVSWLASSRKYKIAEEPIESTVESFEDKLLSIDAKTWYPKGAAEQYAEYLTATDSGDEPPQSLEKINKVERRAGVIAEDMHDAGLGIFVSYAEDGSPDSVMHEGLAPAFIPIIRRLRDRVDALETKLGETA